MMKFDKNGKFMLYITRGHIINDISSIFHSSDIFKDT